MGSRPLRSPRGVRARLGQVFVCCCALALVASASSRARAAEQSPAAAERLEFFEKRIRPLLVERCYTCHSANTNSHGGLRVDDRNGLLTGGNRGAAVIPGDTEKSLLIRAVRRTDKRLKMPPEEPLSDEQIADLERWIADGAAWPAPLLDEAIDAPNPEYDELKRTHWAWQPLQPVAPPTVANAAWSHDPVDRFLLARLETENLRPVADAEKTALLRRVTFDLTGLPPTPAEIDAFLADDSAAAFAKVVDRLLASPTYGERWGRHWLDVARYGESTGSSRNMPYPHAWRYRDYVIDAFNADMPYDQFLREQIAGDLLSATSDDDHKRQLIATGFLALGVKDVNQRFKVRFMMDNVDEQIDTVTRSVLALTASCARCHDHKFDPIPTKDYYALAGIFTSTELCAGVRSKMGGGGLDYYTPQMLLRLASDETPPPDPAAVAAAQAAYDEAKEAFQAIRGTPEGLKKGPNGKPKQRQFRVKMDRALGELLELTDPTLRGDAAMGVRDAEKIADTEVRLRGEAEQLGPVVPRGFLSVVALPETPSVPADHSGRLELAQWLTSADNPLTARVIVNRVWQHLFGQGLVASVDNFGTTGDVPTHPELLDYLAARFVREGWSIKTLVRSLVLTRAYQISAAEDPANLKHDPGNRWVWRHAPRRLDAEELRDATLAAARALDPSRPEASPARELKVVELLDSSPIARKLEAASRVSTSRSVYLPLLRNLTPTSLAVFDFAEQGMVTGSRDATTVATQALYLLNDAFVRRNAVVLAKDLLADDLADAERIALAYRRVLGRAPTADEVARVTAYVSDFASTAQTITPDDAQLAEQSAEQQLPATALAGDPTEPPENPDELPAVEAPPVVETIGPLDPQTAAWASFCQALFGSAEFRYTQ